jgi:aminopeptidase N
MIKSNKFYFYLTVSSITVFLNLSCASTKKVENTSQEEIAEDVKKIELSEIDIYPDEIELGDTISTELSSTRKLHPFRDYRSSPKIDFSLIRTKIDVSFDWAKEYVYGKTTLTLKPHFYPQKQLVLDAKGFDMKSVNLLPKNQNLTYKYDGKFLTIDLDKEYTKTDTLNIFIEYVAKPSEGEEGGSAAITSDKGLFFINPIGDDKEKPMQIWTQGETENNSKWFPTIDKPNQFSTQEVTITVEDKYMTLSNGLKVASKKNSNGTRTDTWKQDKPHTPYLTMIAVGEFAVVKDQWRNIPLEYIVEKEYEPYAKQIFNHTPEMIEFFSSKLEYPFAWDKYSQIIVRDYVSGAMENTTAVVFGEFVQKNDKELIDNDNDAIVAHELFHHWFGNIVTCESWSNLTLQEGLANYAEYLWLEHKYGMERADMHRANELGGYLSSTEQGSIHPLIRYVYGDKEEMFDAHSYNKGGLVLHMLRIYVGEDAFFAALNLYLNKHKHTSVEVDELRMAFEDVVGEDLNWFFDQWFLTEGHPEIEFKYEYDAEKKEIVGYVKQKQTPSFRIPFEVAIIDAQGSSTYSKVWVENPMDTFRISAQIMPSVVILDGKEDILAVVENEFTEEQLFTIMQHSTHSTHRNNAFNQLSYTVEDYDRMINIGVNDKLYSIQTNAISMISEDQFPNYRNILNTLATKGSHSEVRAAAINKLGENLGVSKSLISEILAVEKSNVVLSVALGAFANVDLDEAIQTAELFESMKDDGMLEGIASVYAEDQKTDRFNWFMNNINNKNIYKSYPLFQYLLTYASNQDDDGLTFNKVIEEFYKMGMDQNIDKFKRYVATFSILAIKMQMEEASDDAPKLDAIKINKYLQDIKNNEKDSMLLERYNAQF